MVVQLPERQALYCSLGVVAIKNAKINRPTEITIPTIVAIKTSFPISGAP